VITGDDETVYVHPATAVQATFTFAPESVGVTMEGPLKTRAFPEVIVGPTNDVPVTIGVREIVYDPTAADVYVYDVSVVVIFPRVELLRTNEHPAVASAQFNAITVPVASAINDVGAATIVAVAVTAGLGDPTPVYSDCTLNVYTPGVVSPVIVADVTVDVDVPLRGPLHPILNVVPVVDSCHVRFAVVPVVVATRFVGALITTVAVAVNDDVTMPPDTPTIANEYAPAAKLVYEYVVPVIPATFPAAADVILYSIPGVGLAVQFREIVAPSVVEVKFVGG